MAAGAAQRTRPWWSAALLLGMLALASAQSDDFISPADIEGLVNDPFNEMVKLVEASVTRLVNAVGFYDKLPMNITWSTASKHCEDQGKRLCMVQEYCPHAKGHPPKPGIQVGEAWAPASDMNNEWVYIGNDLTKTCMTHRQLLGFPPSWGHTSETMSFKGNVYCCDMKLETLATSQPTWKEALKFCELRKKRLCTLQEYCPSGPGQAPSGGLLYQAEWAAIFDDVNAWVAVGAEFPHNLMCKSHFEIAKQNPSWGEDGSAPVGPKRGAALCCDDSFVSLPGRITYPEAKAYCHYMGQRLCTYAEYCRAGPGKQPEGGARPGEAWAPLADDDNEWVGVGNGQKELMCHTYSSYYKRKPAWGTSEGQKGYLQCCSGPAPKGADATVQQATGAGIAVQVVADHKSDADPVDVLKFELAKRNSDEQQSHRNAELEHKQRMEALQREKQAMLDRAQAARVAAAAAAEQAVDAAAMAQERARKRARQDADAERHQRAEQVAAAHVAAQAARAKQDAQKAAAAAAAAGVKVDPYEAVTDLASALAQDEQARQAVLAQQQAAVEQRLRKEAALAQQQRTAPPPERPVEAVAAPPVQQQLPATLPPPPAQAQLPPQHIAYDVPADARVQAEEGRVACVCLTLPCSC